MNQAEHYRGDAGRVYHEQKRGVPDVALPWVAAARAKKISPYIKISDTVFEYGVGWGWNLAALKCGRKVGFDIADAVREKVKGQGIEFIAPGQMQDGSVDVVICHHTLEHLADPVAALKKMRRILKPGGKLLLFVPFERESKYTRFERDEANHHLYSWNVQTLGNLVEECGYRVAEGKVAPFGYDRFAAVLAARLHLGSFGFRFVRSCLHVVKPAFEVRVVAVKE